MDQVKNKLNRVLLITVIVILAIVIFYVFWRYFKSDLPQKSVEGCQGDNDCTESDAPICQHGKCVQCAFDSDCCGSEVCSDGSCVPGPPQVIIANGIPIEVEGWPNLSMENDLFGNTWWEADLASMVIDDGGAPIDWSTFTFTRIGYNPGEDFTELPINVEAGTSNVDFTWELGGTTDPPFLPAGFDITPTGRFRLIATLNSFVYGGNGILALCNDAGSFPQEICLPECDLCSGAAGNFSIHWQVSNTDGVTSNVASFSGHTITSV